MNRDPPLHVKRQLRKEVNYGCPVPGCGKPFLEWHHFDPPWHVRNHHDLSGVIALCTEHHPQADAGVFSVEQLRDFKRNPNNRELVCGKFEWMPENCIIRLGGNYAPDRCRVSVGGEDVIRVEKSESEMNDVSFTLRDEAGVEFAKMAENVFTCDTSTVHDLAISSSANRIKIWHERRKVGFECHYSRKSIEDVEKLIQLDCEALKQPPKPIENIPAFYEQLFEIDNYKKDGLAIGWRRRDPVGTYLRWHVIKHRGKDGQIPLLDFSYCRLFGGDGKSIQLGRRRIRTSNRELGCSVNTVMAFNLGNSFSF
mgnify:CR=1 FL=1